MNDDIIDEPQEDDYVTEDFCKFYQYGKLAVRTTEDRWERDVRAHMDKERFWPSIWMISDHGNAHLVR